MRHIKQLSLGSAGKILCNKMQQELKKERKEQTPANSRCKNSEQMLGQLLAASLLDVTCTRGTIAREVFLLTSESRKLKRIQ